MKTKPSGNGTSIHWIDDKEPTLKELQKLVGGNIEIVKSKAGHADMVINEEGKFYCEPNIPATRIWLGPDTREWHDILVGDVVICTGDARLR
jgi:hypothetical protein